MRWHCPSLGRPASRPDALTQISAPPQDGAGAVVGEVHQRWHLWRRNYDLYIDKRQFAAVVGGLLAWVSASERRRGEPSRVRGDAVRGGRAAAVRQRTEPTAHAA